MPSINQSVHRDALPDFRNLGVTLRIVLMVLALCAFATLSMTPSWGGLLADGRNYQTQAPWLVLAPVAALLVLAVGLVVLGSGISDVLRQRARQTAPTSSAAAPYR